MKVGVIDDGCKAWLLANAPEMAAKFGYAGGEAAAGGEGEGEKAAGGGGKKKKDAGVKEVLVSSKQSLLLQNFSHRSCALSGCCPPTPPRSCVFPAGRVRRPARPMEPREETQRVRRST